MLVPFLVGLVLGAAWALGVIFSVCVVEAKETWHEHNHVVTGVVHRVHALVAENAQLRLSLARGEITDEPRKIVEMTMAALEAVIAAEKEAIQEGKRSRGASQEPASYQEGKQ